MKILVTGFEPFGGEKVNPSYEVVKLIKDIENVEMLKLQVPTVFNSSVEKVIESICEFKPDYVLLIGQAAGRSAISVERVAINVDDASIADNDGNLPVDLPIDKEGMNAHFATLPIKEIVKNVKDLGIPCYVSNSAGTYVCNHLMYGVLNYIYKNKLNIKAGFIHIPYMHEQAIDKCTVSSMALGTMVTAIEETINTLKFTLK